MKKNINFLAVIQARLGSSRLPGKVLKKINNKTVIEFLIDRLKLSKKINKIVVATTSNVKDKKILQILKQKKISYYSGSEENVLQRYYRCAKKFNAKNIIRITSDCPLLDYRIVKKVVLEFEKSKVPVRLIR
jgi:Spore coat polysaccharide biosynthesis protein F, CMP-KDO synthetase homolog